LAPDVHHVGLTVGNLDRSVEFYCANFGLREIARNHLDGPLISAQTELPGSEIDVSLLAGNNTIVELLCYRNPAGHPYTLRPCDPGAGHVCIVVDDLEATYASMQERGIVFHAGPTRLMSDETKMLYVHDPDGVMVELLEPSDELSVRTLLSRSGGTAAL
jgi:lactoylglutathione lyase/glyoxylase I family protein